MNVNWRRVFEFTFVMVIVALCMAYALSRWNRAEQAAKEGGSRLNEALETSRHTLTPNP